MKTLIAVLLIAALVQSQDWPTKKEVKSLKCDDVSQDIFTGYLPVRSDGSRIFYQLHTPLGQNLESTKPVIFWMEGGPGQSALFNDLTLCKLNHEGKVVKRENSWNENFFVLAVDAPIGTGFSYAAKDAKHGIEENTADLIAFLIEFIKTFPELRNNHWFLMGEGYAGHSLTHFANSLRGQPDLVMVHGVALGNPWIDPKYQMNWDEFGFVVGLLDTNTRDQIRSLQTDARLKLLNSKTKEAAETIEKTRKVLQELDDQVSINNFGRFHIQQRDDVNSSFHKWVENKTILAEFGVPDFIKFSFFNKTVHDAFNTDFSRSYFSELTELFLTNKVLVWCGQNDYFTNCAGIHNVLKNVPNVMGDWRKTDTQLWTYDGKVKGNVKIIGRGGSSLYYAVVYGAGHFVINDQAHSARDMLNHFLKSHREWTTDTTQP